MKPTPEQRLAIETQDRALVVDAGAGTGKTWVLVQRFMHLLETHPSWPLDSIVAITFTKKAAREMRTRLRQAIEDKARQNPNPHPWQEHRLNLDRLNVSTIHSLCARILKENAIAAEIDPHFQALDEQEAELLKEEAIRETVRVLEEENHPALELLASLRIFDLKAEIESMLAKRGTLYHIFSNLAEPDEMIHVWQAGLEKMRTAIWEQQLREEPNLAEAIGSLANITIKDHEDRLSGSVMAARQGCQEHAQGNIIEAANLWLQINLIGGKRDNWGGKEELDELKQHLRVLREASKALNDAGALQDVGESDRIATQHLHLWRALWERLEQTYSRIKEGQQALDFDDLELLTFGLLHQSPRSHRLDGFVKSINHLMVDEFQDTNLTQQRIVFALAPLDHAGKLFVVGDAKQSIYRFRQAQVSIFNQTAEQVNKVTGYPPTPLSTSFRTHHNLVQAANCLFEQLFLPMGESYEDFEARSGSLSAYRDTQPGRNAPVEILLLPAKDTQGENVSAEDARIWEAQWIAKRLSDLKMSGFQIWDKHKEQYRSFEYRDAAVLFRATTQVPLYEAEFKKSGLPYMTVSGRGYYDRPEVQDLIALLTALADPADDLNLGAVLRSPLFSFSDETLYRLRWYTPDAGRAEKPIPYKSSLSQPPENKQHELVGRAHEILTELWAIANRVDVWTLLRMALDLSSYEATLTKFDGQTGRQHANVRKFLTLARERGEVSLSDFLRRMGDLKALEAREGEALGKEPESGAVQLMSIHASKGLEFPVVVIADMGRQKRAGFGTPYLLHDPAFGVLCKVRDESGDWVKPAGYAWGEWLHERMEEAERRRLLYVACTRAADFLILSGQAGKTNTWLSDVQDAWEIGADRPEEETEVFDGFSAKVFRPSEPPEHFEFGIEEGQENPGLDQVPILVQAPPLQPKPQPVSVTRLGHLLHQKEDDWMRIQPAMWGNDQSLRVKKAPGYLIGNMVHRALHHSRCLEYTESQLLQLLQSYAGREGIFTQALPDAVERSHRMITAFKKSRVYRSICHARQRFHEMPFSFATPTGILHGVIDLLYQDERGNWHIVDWKTEWCPRLEVEGKAQEYLLQMAIYALAVQNSMHIHPRAELCFLSPSVFLYQFSAEELEQEQSKIFPS